VKNAYIGVIRELLSVELNVFDRCVLSLSLSLLRAKMRSKHLLMPWIDLIDVSIDFMELKF
jgi:hypothetical protein